MITDHGFVRVSPDSQWLRNLETNLGVDLVQEGKLDKPDENLQIPGENNQTTLLTYDIESRNSASGHVDERGAI